MNGKEQIIHTSRLVLREINEYDAESALDILTHKEVSKTFLLPDFKCREDALPVFESLKRTSHDPARFVYGIYLDGNMIGFLNEVEKNGTEIELGYVIHPTYQRNGYATEALGASMNALFKMGYDTVKTAAFEENLASIRVMEKSGMTRLSYTDTLEYRGEVHRCVWFEKRVEKS